MSQTSVSKTQTQPSQAPTQHETPHTPSQSQPSHAPPQPSQAPSQPQSSHNSSQPSQQQQQQQPHSESKSDSFQIPDGPPQPHPREEIQGDNQSNSSGDPKSKEHKPAIGPDEEVSNEQAQELGLPEQKHSGKIGLGPEYANINRVGFAEKLQGVKEQIIGTIKRDHDLVNKGKERRTGELKKKQKEEEDNSDPFATAEEKKEKSEESTAPTDGKDQKDDGDDKKQTKQTNDTSSANNKSQPDASSVKFTNGSHPGDSNKGQTQSKGNVDASDRKQVQEKEQEGRTGDVDLNPGEGRVDPVNSEGNRNKEVERAAAV